MKGLKEQLARDLVKRRIEIAGFYFLLLWDQRRQHDDKQPTSPATHARIKLEQALTVDELYKKEKMILSSYGLGRGHLLPKLTRLLEKMVKKNIVEKIYDPYMGKRRNYRLKDEIIEFLDAYDYDRRHLGEIIYRLIHKLYGIEKIRKRIIRTVRNKPEILMIFRLDNTEIKYRKSLSRLLNSKHIVMNVEKIHHHLYTAIHDPEKDITYLSSIDLDKEKYRVHLQKIDNLLIDIATERMNRTHKDNKEFGDVLEDVRLEFSSIILDYCELLILLISMKQYIKRQRKGVEMMLSHAQEDYNTGTTGT